MATVQEIIASLNASATRADTSSTQMYGVANGPAAGPGSTVATDSGPVPTLLKWFADNQAAIDAQANLAGQLVASDGSTRVSFTAFGTGAATRSLQSKNRDFVHVRDFGVTGDGSGADMTRILAAVAAAGANDLYWSPGNTIFTTNVNMPVGQRWRGAGGQRATTITKAFNGDLVTMNDQTGISDINFECAGATRTGRGLFVASGFNQFLSNIRIGASESFALDFANNVGAGFDCTNLTADRYDASTGAAVRLIDNSAVPRFFKGLWLSGNDLDISNGGNGTSISNFYIRNLITGAGTNLAHFGQGRFATLTGTTTLAGGGLTISSVSFSGPVALVNAQGYRFACSTFSGGFTEDAASRFNDISDQRKMVGDAQWPALVWNQASGTQPVLGDGTIDASYQRHGYECTVRFRLTMGSTTTYGNNATGYQFGIPFIGQQNDNQRMLGALLTDVSSGQQYVCQITIGANQQIMRLGYNGQAVRDGYPFAWAAGDTIDVQTTYMVR